MASRLDEATPQDSPGARLIIEESKLASPDDKLYVAFLGPLTDMASAILLDPAIVDRDVVVIWIGGVGYGGVETYPKPEFNLGNDIAAANVVFGSGITVWQVPQNVYSQVSVGYAELEEKIGGTSELADHLIRQLVEGNATWHPEPIESRSLGDSPAISLMLYPRGGQFRIEPDPPAQGPTSTFLPPSPYIGVVDLRQGPRYAAESAIHADSLRKWGARNADQPDAVRAGPARAGPDAARPRRRQGRQPG